MSVSKFEVGKTYQTNAICNSDCTFEIKVIKRTAKTIVVEQYAEKPRRMKIWLDDKGQECVTLGSYSMAPTFRAERDLLSDAYSRELEAAQKLMATR